MIFRQLSGNSQAIRRLSMYGDFRTKNVLQMTFSAILECLEVKGSRTRNSNTFWNPCHGPFLEWLISFHSRHQTIVYYRTPIVPEVPALGTLEPLLIGHSGMAKKGKKAKKGRTKDVLQMTFFRHSGMPRNQRF